jgi:hypothetical protein
VDTTIDRHKKSRFLLRPSEEIKKKVDEIQRKMGFKTQEITLDYLLGNVNPDDFPSPDTEVIIRPKGIRG